MHQFAWGELSGVEFWAVLHAMGTIASMCDRILVVRSERYVLHGLLWRGTVVLAEEGKECRMSLLGWLVGAALVGEWGRREEEEEARKEAERKMQDLRRQNDANERKIRRLEADLKALKGRGPRAW